MEQLNKSYLCGTSSLPLLYATIPELLDHRASQYGDRPAHIFRDLKSKLIGQKDSILDPSELTKTVVTYNDLSEKSLKVAAALLKHGLKPGDRIAVLGSNSPEWLYLDYACLRINVLMIRVPGSLIFHDALVEVLSKFDCKIFFLDKGEVTEKMDNILPGLLSGNLVTPDKTKLADVKIMFLRAPDDCNSWITVETLTGCEDDTHSVKSIQESLDPDDIAVVLPTSGSTGFPKFVTYSHAKIINASNIAMTGFDPDNRGHAIVCTDRPMAWVGGLHFGSISAGFTFVQVDQRISFMEKSTELTFQIMSEEKATGVAIMAYMLYDAMKAHKDGILDIPQSMENVITGGERLSQDLIQFVKETFKSVLVYYGLTEGYHCFKNKPMAQEGVYTTEMMPHTELKVVDDAGKVLPRGLPGNLHIRSPITMINFLDEAGSTERILSSSGWLNTEDIAVVDKSGFVDVIGRTKDIISTGGRKVYPKTIERLMMNCPKVENVIVIGVPDVRLFQAICACVLPRVGEQLVEDDLRSYCTSKMLGRAAAAPQYYWIVDSFPKGTTGKFDRLTLTRMAKEHFNL